MGEGSLCKKPSAKFWVFLVLLVVVLAAIIIVIYHTSRGNTGPDVETSTWVPQAGPQDTTTTSSTIKTESPYGPLERADFVADCHGPIDSDMRELCWLNETSLLWYERKNGGRVWRFEIDTETKVCLSSILYANVSGQHMACSPNGTILISDSQTKSVVHIIQDGGQMTEWFPEDSHPVPIDITRLVVNSQYIVLAENGWTFTHLIVFNMNREYQYTITEESDDSIDYLSLSPSGLLATTTVGDGLVTVMNMTNNATIQFGNVGQSGNESKRLNYPTSVCFDASENYVLVDEYATQKISVFNIEGDFIDYVDLGKGGSNVGFNKYMSIVHREGRSSLLAIELVSSRSRPYTVKIYSIGP